MSYISRNELSFAEDYYMIDWKGVVTFADGTPKEIIDRFWDVWEEFREKVIALQKEGILTSRYPVLPFEDPEENKKHYYIKEKNIKIS